MSHIWAGRYARHHNPILRKNGEINHAFLADHASWLVDNGCTGIVACGSLGEGGSLSMAEKAALLKTLVQAVGKRVPVISAVSALTTKEAVDSAKRWPRRKAVAA